MYEITGVFFLRETFENQEIQQKSPVNLIECNRKKENTVWDC